MKLVRNHGGGLPSGLRRVLQFSQDAQLCFCWGQLSPFISFCGNKCQLAFKIDPLLALKIDPSTLFKKQTYRA